MAAPSNDTLDWRLQAAERRLDRAEDELDAKADRSDVAELRKRMDWVIASMWALTIAIVTSAITFAVTAGGH